MGWPSTLKKGWVIGGQTPGADLWRVSKPRAYCTERHPKNISLAISKAKPQAELLNLRPASGWKGTESSKNEAQEAMLHIGNREHSCRYYLHLSDRRVAICRDKDLSKPVALLSKEQWSPWIIEQVNGLEIVFRLKLVELSPEGRYVELYCSDVYKTEGWASPKGLEKELIENVGPYTEGLECPYIPVDIENRPYGPLNVDSKIVLELAEFQASWFSDTASYMLDKHGWDLLFMHYHLIDALNHTFLAHLYSRHPYGNSELSEETWKIYHQAHAIVDSMIARIVERCADEETVVVLTSDHGALPCWKFVWIGKALIDAGLLAYRWNVRANKYDLDLGNSKVAPYYDPQHIWINLKGREPGGIVEPDEYEKIRDQIIAALYSIRDPENGQCPIQLAIRREDIELSGKGDKRVGDVLYFATAGYSTWNGTINSLRFATIRPEQFDEPAVTRSKEVLGHHTPWLPATRLDIFSNTAVTVAWGPGLRQGYTHPWPIHLKDIVPTVAHLMGFPGPRDADGAVLHTFFEE